MPVKARVSPDGRQVAVTVNESDSLWRVGGYYLSAEDVAGWTVLVPAAEKKSDRNAILDAFEKSYDEIDGLLRDLVKVAEDGTVVPHTYIGVAARLLLALLKDLK